MNRVGTGWDIHKLVSGRALVLGGVKIESGKGCLGHSDGDALIHAVIDSLLGAAALGDIGFHFPDTDMAYKDVSSLVLLKKTSDLLKGHGFSVINVDCTVILQSPKLAPYKDLMALSIASCLGLDASCVNVKAKTAEYMLNELGSGDAVVCQAVAMVCQNPGVVEK